MEGQTEQGHITVSDADWNVPFNAAVTATAASPLGVALAAVIGKVEVDEEAGTVTEDGTVTAELLAETDVATPPVGATAERVTVQVPLAPALRIMG